MYLYKVRYKDEDGIIHNDYVAVRYEDGVEELMCSSEILETEYLGEVIVEL